MSSRVAVLLAVVASAGATADRAALQQLYRDGQWFNLKEKIDRTGAPAFYRGAVALAFNQPSVAEKEFATLFRKAPASWEAREAHRLLSVWSSFTGQYQRSLEEYVAFAKLASGDPSVEHELWERRLWSRHAPLAVTSRRYSKVRFTTKDGDLFVPISINGAEARYLAKRHQKEKSVR